MQDPVAILAPHVREGMTVLEPGPGMGFFTLELARLVGPRGRVVAVDVQSKMLETLLGRAARKGLRDRIEVRLVQGAGLGVENLAGEVDFVLAFAVVHELPDVDRFFREAHAALRPGGRMLVAEPTHHVTGDAFGATLASAERAGFRLEARPVIRSSRTALLAKQD
jgi:ubiquinone/menaquinone biosynthesis C-methylase UbiE